MFSGEKSFCYILAVTIDSEHYQGVLLLESYYLKCDMLVMFTLLVAALNHYLVLEIYDPKDQSL